MPNNKYVLYLIKGPQSLLDAANQELKSLFNHQTVLGPYPNSKGLAFTGDMQPWYTFDEAPTDVVLTLPQDWNKLMEILEELKKPEVPEYVKHNPLGKVFKVSSFANHTYQAYGVTGVLTSMSSDVCTPITEQEFIQGGLKELEEAGFVVGAKVKYPVPNGGTSFQIAEILYSSPTHRADWHSQLSGAEERNKGFVFGLKGEYNHVPVGICTILPTPQAPILPTTSHGIPYLKVKGEDKIYIGVEPSYTLNRNEVGRWKNLGVQSITLPCGTLTQEDLTTLASL